MQIVDVGETLSLFMELQTLGDRTLKKMAFDHVVHSIRRMNQKHKNEAKNRALQNVLFAMLQVCESSSPILKGFGFVRVFMVLNWFLWNNLLFRELNFDYMWFNLKHKNKLIQMYMNTSE